MRIPILMYHRIALPSNAKEARYSVAPSRFKEQMVWLREEGYTVLALDKIDSFLKDIGDIPQKAVVLTFDDGFADFKINAFPVLSELGYPVTVFIISGKIGGVSEWLQPEGGHAWPLMGWSDLFEIREYGVSIGSHGMTHRSLTHLSRKQMESEIRESRQLLEDHLGCSIRQFAYPYGDINRQSEQLVREAGYDVACSTKSGFNVRGEELFALRRLDVYGSDTIRNFDVKLTYGTNNGGWTTPARYYGKRILQKLGG